MVSYKNMYRGNKPRVFPIIITILVIAFIVAAIVSLGRMLFVGGDSPSTTEAETVSSVRDETLAVDGSRAVRYTVRGPIVADENYRSYQITITPTTRSFTLYKGYLDEQIENQIYTNSREAYEQFVHALDKANIGQTRELKEDDLRGVCATAGRAYKYETLQNNVATRTIWTSTCPESPGSMAASVPKIHALFANQLPEFKPVFDKIQ